MKVFLFNIYFLSILFSACDTQWGEYPESIIDTVKVAYPIPIEQLQGRDPFVFADEVSETYYLTFNNQPHFRMYSSKDLENWKDEGYIFSAGADFWGKQDFWAPDLYKYQNKFYIFATFSAPSAKRGTSILIADKVTGPYKPLENRAITPTEWMSLDGSLFIDEEDTPWIVFCREWLEVTDGLIYAQRLTPDLKTTIGTPLLLLNASAAAWAAPIRSGNTIGYVTDAPFLYKTASGKLQMLWSSFDKNGNYAIGVAESESGTVEGPWRHLPDQLNNDDGGHAMIFKGFDGYKYISYHVPNSGTPRPRITKIEEVNGSLIIK
ncbi:glycoside hydrolase family 43 protein [Sphingobacterium chuzhouense]|uniref:Family 43 glycosylhydrolase n=1 Tax=Sphingobacterium chuzhouense TaxID=1742264 RepID=A0ABR7XN56_9SPHI|nr:glycoside hydrolase family 43 protein [Sphingobacterium chuzhouense]MBD1420597.1 family 43 glycosylhydrolase [Sphingobacterium chuzhouense]